MNKRGYRYLLGDSRPEAVRLRAQARLWDPTAEALFDRLGVRPGWKVLEIGPGQGSVHLALRRRVRGPIDAVERSPAFVARLKALCARDGRGAGRIWQSDIEDYHRETWAMIPRPAEWSDFIAADRYFFASQGADSSVGSRLPELYRRAGLKLVEVVPTIRVARPGSLAWRGMTAYFLSVSKRYGRFAPLTPDKARRLRRQWLAAGRDPSSVMIAPAVLDVVARKPRRR